MNRGAPAPLSARSFTTSPRWSRKTFLAVEQWKNTCMSSRPPSVGILTDPTAFDAFMRVCRAGFALVAMTFVICLLSIAVRASSVTCTRELSKRPALTLDIAVVVQAVAKRTRNSCREKAAPPPKPSPPVKAAGPTFRQILRGRPH